MRETEPPSIAHWMLEQLMPGERDQALAGDLLEEFRSGRSAAWFRRQVVSAVFIRCSQEILGHRIVILFAFFWSMLAPAWLLAIANLEAYANFGAFFSRMNWPWSSICDLGLLLATNLIFAWTGILLYLTSDLWVVGNLRVRELGRGIVASLPVLIALWAALIVLPGHFLAASVGRPFLSPASLYSIQSLAPGKAAQTQLQQRQWERNDDDQVDANAAGSGASPRAAIVDMSMPATVARLPFFLVVLCTLWAARPTAGRHKGIAV
jgi:hypothetical protein